MPNSPTPNMGIVTPTVSTDAGPGWATTLNACFTTIDNHDHTSGKGAPLTPAGMNISVDLPFNSNRITNLLTARMVNNGGTLTGGSDRNQVYVANGELYYNDNSGNVVQATATGKLLDMQKYNVKNYAAKGDGTTDDTTALSNAITAAGTGGHVFIPAGTYKITTNLTFTNAVVEFAAGASLKLASSLVATFNGQVSAPPVPIFTNWDNTITPVVLSSTQTWATPIWWGCATTDLANGGAGVDQTTATANVKAIQQCMNACKRTYFPAGTYLVNAAVNPQAASDIVIWGDGQHSIIKFAMDPTATPAYGNWNVTVSNPRGTNSNYGAFTFMPNTSNIRVSNLRFYGSTQTPNTTAGDTNYNPYFIMLQTGASSPVAAHVTINGADGNGNVSYTAKAPGVAGNGLAVVHLGGVSQTLAVSVSGQVVTVQLGTNGGGTVTSTATQVAAAVNASSAATTLLSAAASGTGASIAGVQTQTSLGGGSDPSAPTIDRITIDACQFENNNQGTIWQDTMFGVGRLTATNCKFFYIGWPEASGPSWVPDTAHTQSIANLLSVQLSAVHVVFTNNQFEYCCGGPFLSGSHALIANNSLKEILSNGISVGDNPEVDQITIHGNVIDTTCAFAGGGSPSINYRAISLQIGTGTPAVNNVVVSSNVIRMVTTAAGAFVTGIFAADVNCTIANNTLQMEMGTTVLTGSGKVVGIDLWNNNKSPVIKSSNNHVTFSGMLSPTASNWSRITGFNTAPQNTASGSLITLLSQGNSVSGIPQNAPGAAVIGTAFNYSALVASTNLRVVMEGDYADGGNFTFSNSAGNGTTIPMNYTGTATKQGYNQGLTSGWMQPVWFAFDTRISVSGTINNGIANLAPMRFPAVPPAATADQTYLVVDTNGELRQRVNQYGAVAARQAAMTGLSGANVPANATATQACTVTNAALGMNAVVGWDQGAPPAGLIVWAQVTASDVVTVYMSNVTGSGIAAPNTGNWTINVIGP